MLRLTGDHDLVRALQTGGTAALTPRESAMVEFSLALTRPRPALTDAAVAALREAGLDDGEILDLTQIVGYFAFVNRLADALGVPLEPFHRTAAGGSQPT